MKKIKKQVKKQSVMQAGALTVGPFKKVTYYEADIEGPQEHLDAIAAVGKQVITQAQYLNIGMNHIIANMVNNKCDITPESKTKKPQQKKQVERSQGILIDPPSGWQYGFPARYIEEEHGTMEQFLRIKKYPEKDIKFAMQYMRYIGEEDT